MRSPDGSLSKTVSMSVPLKGAETSENSDYRLVPGGGVAVMTDVWTGNQSYTVHYSRFDANGDPTFETHIVKIAGGKETNGR